MAAIRFASGLKIGFPCQSAVFLGAAANCSGQRETWPRARKRAVRDAKHGTGWLEQAVSDAPRFSFRIPQCERGLKALSNRHTIRETSTVAKREGHPMRSDPEASKVG